MSSKYKKLTYTDRLVSTKLYKQKKKGTQRIITYIPHVPAI